MRRVLAWLLALCCLAGCGRQQGKETPPAPEQTQAPEQTKGSDLTAGVTARPVEGGAVTEAGAQAVTDFGLTLFQACMEGEDPLVSPLSVLEALGMTANGAAGETLAQMEEAFGLDVEALNSFLLAYRQGLGDGVSLANGIWLNDGSNAAVKEDFLQADADWYGAAVTARPFDDAGRDEINAWVKDHTAGRIESILDKLDPAAVLVLVNALAFDGRIRCRPAPSPMPPARGRTPRSCGPRRRPIWRMTMPRALSSTTRAGTTPSRRCCRRRA